MSKRFYFELNGGGVIGVVVPDGPAEIAAGIEGLMVFEAAGPALADEVYCCRISNPGMRTKPPPSERNRTRAKPAR